VLSALKWGIAAVWLTFGLVFKVLGLVPRHEAIVAAVVGDSLAPFATRTVGAAEVGVGLWVLSGRAPYPCAMVQTLLIVAMNAVELSRARDLLLAPSLMPLANTIFLAAVWLWARGVARRRAVPS
jgi:hypothetical protein